MRNAYSAYPEVLCVDGTYKLLDLRLPVYIFLCEDSMGLSEVVAVCILVQEDQSCIDWLLNCLKKHNPAWTKTRVVMTDKDLRLREALATALPGVKLLLCLFHTLKSFKREVTSDKLGISASQRSVALELLQKLAYARSESDYARLHQQLTSNCAKPICDYFNKNWHPIHQQWVMGIVAENGNFLNTTNNRLEAFNSKLKSIIPRYSTLETFVTQVFALLSSLRQERDHQAAVSFQKVKVDRFPCNSAEHLYSLLLTPYASSYVTKQLQTKVDQSKFTADHAGGYTFSAHRGDLQVTSNSCTCIFWSSMSLPCRHIFGLRRLLNVQLYEESLCNQRWTREFYRQTQRLFSSTTAQPTISVAVSSTSIDRPLSHLMKHKNASLLTDKLASLVAEESGERYKRRIEMLQQLCNLWTEGKDATIVELEVSDDTTDSSMEQQSVAATVCDAAQTINHTATAQPIADGVPQNRSSESTQQSVDMAGIQSSSIRQGIYEQPRRFRPPC